MTISVGYTRNMGNFESLRVDIGIEDSVRTTDGEGREGIDNAFKRVYAYAQSKLIEKVRETEKELNDVRG